MVLVYGETCCETHCCQTTTLKNTLLYHYKYALAEFSHFVAGAVVRKD